LKVSTLNCRNLSRNVENSLAQENRFSPKNHLHSSYLLEKSDQARRGFKSSLVLKTE
jgi:hypothetical protein